MLIFVISSVYPNSNAPGAGVFVKQYVDAMQLLGHKMIVLDVSSYNYKHWRDDKCRHTSVRKDGEVIVYEKHIRGLMISRLPRLATILSKNNIEELYDYAVKENGKPDLIVAHFSLPAGFAANILARKTGVPLIVIEHESIYLSDNVHPYIKKKLRELVLESKKFICVSNSLKRYLELHSGIYNKIVVIYNSIDDMFAYKQQEENDEFVFFSAGNFWPNKRFDLLIKSFVKAFKNSTKVKLRIAGEGVEKKNLMKLIEDNNAENQISLIGYVPHHIMAEEYEHCNCFILLSEKETFGIVYREAMAVGRPIIATKNGGVEEKWTNGNGILLEDCSETVVAEAMKQIIDNYPSYNQYEISKRCADNYSRVVVSEKHNSIILNVIKESLK